MTYTNLSLISSANLKKLSISLHILRKSVKIPLMPSHSATITKVKQIVRRKLSNESTGHDYWHAYRVANLALKLAKIEGGNPKVLELAAWLHDIEVPRSRKNHHLNGSKTAKKILTKLNVPKNTIQSVCNCILKHRYTTKSKPTTIEEKIIQDADNLDALGATIITRIFAHAGATNMPIFHPKLKPNHSQYLKTGKSTTAINHIFEKLLHIPKILNTKTAKKLSKPRTKFLKTFVNQYLAEFKGQI